jgi:hypothetical protein
LVLSIDFTLIETLGLQHDRKGALFGTKVVAADSRWKLMARHQAACSLALDDDDGNAHESEEGTSTGSAAAR